jgi:hypothetical protein
MLQKPPFRGITRASFALDQVKSGKQQIIKYSFFVLLCNKKRGIVAQIKNLTSFLCRFSQKGIMGAK